MANSFRTLQSEHLTLILPGRSLQDNRTGDRRQETGDRRQETRDKRQERGERMGKGERREDVREER